MAIDSFAFAGQAEIGVLQDYSSTLTYLNGNCSWTVTTTILGEAVQDIPLGVGPQRVLEGGGDSDELILQCVSLEDGSMKLHAVVKIYGK